MSPSEGMFANTSGRCEARALAAQRDEVHTDYAGKGHLLWLRAPAVLLGRARCQLWGRVMTTVRAPTVSYRSDMQTTTQSSPAS